MSKVISRVSAKDILGGARVIRPAQKAVEPVNCFACSAKLPAVRLAALRSLSTPFDGWTCIKCSELVVTPRLGIFMGEVGTSELRIVDKIYDDSVQGVFMEQEAAVDEEEETKEVA